MPTNKLSVFSCPICASALSKENGSLKCDNGHVFDLSASGYVNLLPAQKKHSKTPGDSKEMVTARRNFLSKDYYGPLRDALKSVTEKLCKEGKILDCGCGEGYYTDALGKNVFGVDLSKAAIEKAAKKYKNPFFAVASVYDLPVFSGSVDLLVNVFAPLAIDEFRRVLKPGGYFVYVVPAEKHLLEMKKILYDKPYENVFSKTEYDGFEYIENEKVAFPLDVIGKDDVSALFKMTPYLWRTPKEGVERLEKTERLCDTAEFYVHILKKEEKL